MGYHQDRRSHFSVHRLKRVQKHLRGSGIQRSGRLVGADQLRLRYNRSGAGTALLLSAGYLYRKLNGDHFDTKRFHDKTGAYHD